MNTSNSEKVIKKNKKKKLIVFFSHSSQLVGAERSMLDLISQLKEKNIFSHVILPNHGPMEKKLAEENIAYDILDLSWWADLKTSSIKEIIKKDSTSLKNLINFLPK